jgi:hypothetical protein
VVAKRLATIDAARVVLNRLAQRPPKPHRNFLYSSWTRGPSHVALKTEVRLPYADRRERCDGVVPRVRLDPDMGGGIEVPALCSFRRLARARVSSRDGGWPVSGPLENAALNGSW